MGLLSMLESVRASLYQHRRDIISLVVLEVLALIIFLPMMLRWIPIGDYPAHNGLALDFINNPAEFLSNVPHFLYHLLTAFIYWLMGSSDMGLAGAWTMLLCYIAVLWLLYWQFRQAMSESHSFFASLIAIFFAVSILLLTPISFFTPKNLYFGYFTANVYHNPTINLVKPFTILIFFLSVQLFGREKSLSRWWILPFALLTFLSLIAKPSFMLAFVPSLGLICLFFLLRDWRESFKLLLRPLDILRGFFGIGKQAELPRVLQSSFINWPVLLAGIVLPTFAVLYYQTLTWTSSGGIGIEPFRLFNEWSIQYDENANKLLAFKFIMSSAFPLVVYLLHLPRTWRDFSFNLGWVFYFVSLAYAYLLVDYTDIDAGDWSWSAQLGIFMLYVVATIFLLQQYSKQLQTSGLKSYQWLTLTLCILIFGLHLIAGIHWYRLQMTEDVLVLIYQWW
jgi:hypothetical protein